MPCQTSRASSTPTSKARSLRSKAAKVVHFEPYVNPTMEVLDTPALIKIAKEAVSEAELMAEIDSANAKRNEVDGQDVWVVTLSGDDKSATVTVDAFSGEVIELDVQ